MMQAVFLLYLYIGCLTTALSYISIGLVIPEIGRTRGGGVKLAPSKKKLLSSSALTFSYIGYGDGRSKDTKAAGNILDFLIRDVLLFLTFNLIFSQKVCSKYLPLF